MNKKYFKYILLTFILLMFGFILNVNALTCNYVAPYDQLSGAKEVKVSCTLSSSENKCYIDTEGKNNAESIINWKGFNGNITNFNAYDYVINNNTCPAYAVFVMDSTINGYKIFAADNETTAGDIVINAKKIYGQDFRISSSTSNINQDKSNKAYENIVNYTKTIESITANFTVSSCIKNDKTITRISECKKSLQSYRSNIATFKNNVQAYIDTNVVSKDDSRVKKFYEAIQKCESSLNSIDKQLKEEQKKIDVQMGTEEGISVSEKENGKSNNKIKYLSDICKTDKNLMIVFRFFGYLLFIVKILVPIGLIAFGVMTFSKAILSGDDLIKKNAYSFAKKIIMAIVVFVLPTIINFVIGLIDGATDGTNNYKNCRTCIFDPKNCKIPD